MANITLRGAGEVLDAGLHLCAVNYRLQQVDNPSGHSEIAGEILVDLSERQNVEVLNTLGSGNLLTLKLDDSRELEVFFNPIDAIGGSYKIVVGLGNSPIER